MSLTPKNWTSFQHYKNRSPAWIKLHRGILDDYDFARLPIASKALAPLLWLLASEYEDGKITCTFEELAFRLRMQPKEFDEAVKPLIDSGFFECASEVLARRKRSASLEKEKEKEKEKEGEGEKRERPRATRIPDDFHLSDDLIEFSATHGFAGDVLQSVFSDFCDYWRSRDGPNARKLDWAATWRRWIREEAKKPRSQRYGNGKPTVQDAAAALASRLKSFDEPIPCGIRSGAQPVDVRLLSAGGCERPGDVHGGDCGSAGGIPAGGHQGRDGPQEGPSAKVQVAAVRS